MPSISFIYRTRNHPNAVYTGKYISEDKLIDNQVIDVFIKKQLLDCLNNYRFNRGYREIRHGDINVGVIGVMDTVNFNTYRECKAFDFYFHNNVFFLNGRKVHVSEYQKTQQFEEEQKEDNESSLNEMP